MMQMQPLSPKMKQVIKKLLRQSPDITVTAACSHLLFQEHACLDRACIHCPLSLNGLPRRSFDSTRLETIVDLYEIQEPTRCPDLVFDPNLGWHHALSSTERWCLATIFIPIPLISLIWLW